MTECIGTAVPRPQTATVPEEEEIHFFIRFLTFVFTFWPQKFRPAYLHLRRLATSSPPVPEAKDCPGLGGPNTLKIII